MCCMSFSCLYSMKFLKMMKSRTLWASFKQIMLHSPVIYIFTYLFSMILGLFFKFLVQLVLISKSPKIHKNFTHQINKIGKNLATADLIKIVLFIVSVKVPLYIVDFFLGFLEVESAANKQIICCFLFYCGRPSLSYSVFVGIYFCSFELFNYFLQ